MNNKNREHKTKTNKNKKMFNRNISQKAIVFKTNHYRRIYLNPRKKRIALKNNRIWRSNKKNKIYQINQLRAMVQKIIKMYKNNPV